MRNERGDANAIAESSHPTQPLHRTPTAALLPSELCHHGVAVGAGERRAVGRTGRSILGRVRSAPRHRCTIGTLSMPTNDESAVQTYIKHMLAYSVRLVRNARSVYDKPETSGIASAIMLQRPHAVVLLTAGHSFWKPGDWTWETNVVVAGETLSLRLPELQQLVQVDVQSNTVIPIDVAWCRIDQERIRQVLTKINPRRPPTLTLPVYKGPVGTEPNAEAAYGYAAWNRGWLDANLRKYVVEPSFEVGMRYIGRSESDLLMFQLARPHQGDEYYQGASGSGIAAEDGTVISILLGGENDRDILYGLDLPKYALLLDAATK